MQANIFSYVPPSRVSITSKNIALQDEPVSILLVESDINWGRFLQDYLTQRGYAVQWTDNGQAAWKHFSSNQYNFCIIRPELPTISGIELAARIRQRAEHIPIVFMTPLQENTEAVRRACFEAGADDLMCRPCDLYELEYRIRAIRKRFRFCAMPSHHRVFDLGRRRFNYDKQWLFNKQKHICLTGKEAALLYALCLKRGEVLACEQALLSVWNSTERYNTQSMQVYISKLRQYLSAYTNSEIINVHGVGYKLVTYRGADLKRKRK